MKRAVAALLAACMVLLTGCASQEDTSTKEADKTQSNVTKSQPASLNTKTHCWGQGKQFNDLNQPTSCTLFNQEYGKYDAVFVKETTDPVIMLTFDEGYENGYTAEILDVLKEKQVPAVFFVTGDYVKRSAELVQRMVNEGHVIGNHTENHPSMPSLSPSEMQTEIQTLHDTVQGQFGFEMSLFRPPKGEFSEQSLAVTQQLGYTSVCWSFAYADWDPDDQPDPTSALQTLVERLHPGAIYLLHAVSCTNAQILGDFIDAARAAGYTFEIYTE